MSVTDLSFLPLHEVSGRIARRMLSPLELVAELLDRIARDDRVLHSYITVCAETVMAEARVAETAIARGDWRGPLHGIPISHKDVSATAGVRTTAHSRVLADFIPREDATHVRRLRDAGAILLGETNTTEFACGARESFGTPPTPWNTRHYAGSSSCGSGAALAADLAVAATGINTGGSVRIPASFCGIVGLRPSFGRVSRLGVVPLSWSMDQVGPMARVVKDCALLLQAMAGANPLDSSTSDHPVPDYTAGLDGGVDGMVERLDGDVEVATRTALRWLEHLGARLEPVSLPHAADLTAIGALIQMVEGFARHARRLREHAALYGTRARQRIAAGAFYSAADYLQALQIRRSWCEELDRATRHLDAVVTPTTPFSAITIAAQELGPPSTGANTFPFSLSG